MLFDAAGDVARAISVSKPWLCRNSTMSSLTTKRQENHSNAAPRKKHKARKKRLCGRMDALQEARDCVTRESEGR